MRKMSLAVISAAVVSVFAINTAVADDFGQTVQNMLSSQSLSLFGFTTPITSSAPTLETAYRTSTQTATEQITLATGLNVQYLTRKAADKTDMMAFYPVSNPTHLISCIEGGRETLADGRFNPSVQSINLATGEVMTLLRGMSGCDGIRATAWGTILATEEEDDGKAYEILNPLQLNNAKIIDRASGETSVPTQVVQRKALPTMAWEGIEVLRNGVVYAGDELRPGTDIADVDGGAIFKFVPEMPWKGTQVTQLEQSPLAKGTVWAMQVSCLEDVQQYGQGCEVGNAVWVKVLAQTARSSAVAAGATGYYRPEDLHRDVKYVDSAYPTSIKVCWTNTGREAASHYGEVMCAVDRAPLSASNTERTVAVNRFIEGDKDFNSVDNLAFQPKTGNLYVIEDHENGDIFACLPDGKDRDLKSDGCVKMLSVKDSSAEPTGFIFSPDGKTAYLSIQHSNDSLMSPVDGYGTDDVLKITGFKLP